MQHIHSMCLVLGDPVNHEAPGCPKWCLEKLQQFKKMCILVVLFKKSKDKYCQTQITVLFKM